MQQQPDAVKRLEKQLKKKLKPIPLENIIAFSGISSFNFLSAKDLSPDNSVPTHRMPKPMFTTLDNG